MTETTQEARRALMAECLERITDEAMQSKLTLGELRAVLLSLTTSVISSSEPTFPQAAAHFEMAVEAMGKEWMMPELVANRAKLLKMAADTGMEALRP